MKAFWPKLGSLGGGVKQKRADSPNDSSSQGKSSKSESGQSVSVSASGSQTLTSMSENIQVPLEHRGSMWTVDLLEKHNRNKDERIRAAAKQGVWGVEQAGDWTGRQRRINRELRRETAQEVKESREVAARVEREKQEEEERKKKGRYMFSNPAGTRISSDVMRRRLELLRVFGGQPVEPEFERILENPVLLQMLQGHFVQAAAFRGQDDAEEEADDDDPELWEDGSEEGNSGSHNEEDNRDGMQEEELP